VKGQKRRRPNRKEVGRSTKGAARVIDYPTGGCTGIDEMALTDLKQVKVVFRKG